MSRKSSIEVSGSSNHIGLILLDSPAQAMNFTEYSNFLTYIIREDGNLDCVPPGIIFFSMDGGTRYGLWHLPEYLLSIKRN